MAPKFLNRDFPDIPPDMIELRQSRRISIILFVATHGLWVMVCAIALALSLNDAFPRESTHLVAGTNLEIR
jgi:hypothetical protein